VFKIAVPNYFVAGLTVNWILLSCIYQESWFLIPNWCHLSPQPVEVNSFLQFLPKAKLVQKDFSAGEETYKKQQYTITHTKNT